MKPINLIIFLTVFFSIYGVVNYYIFIRGSQALSLASPYRLYYAIIFIVVSLSFIIGRTLENYWLTPLSKTFVWIGSLWLAAMLYFILWILLLDILRSLNHFIPFFPGIITGNYALVKQILGGVIILSVGTIIVIGHFNAIDPKIEKLHLKIQKKSQGMKSVNIVVASDIHLGSIVGKNRFDKIVAMINGLNPDIVLLPGDIVDEDLAPVIKDNLGESLRNVKPRFGVYAVTGNHEYIGGVEKACRYLEENGVKVLRDQTILVNHTLYLVGREDRSLSQFGGKTRKSLDELMSKVDSTVPVILMDHQPFRLEEAKQHNVDLQLSGHTHHGQLWPLNFITRAVYEISWGYRRDGNTNYYVSCGVGTWGPPVRTGNRPEIVNIIMDFE